MTVLVELNDLEVRAWSADGEQIYGEPCAVTSVNGSLQFGTQALSVSRANPQQFNNKFLHRFSADPLPADIGPAKNHADLIYHQLQALSLAEQEVVWCVPSHLNNQQLGLLLGICKQADVRVRGFVDMALAYTLSTPVEGELNVLDIELHRSSVANVRASGDQLQMREGKTLETLGASAITDGWISVIADEFVQKTRFDPLHTGVAEQQVFDTVWSWLGQSEAHNAHIQVSHSQHTRDIEVTAKVLTDKLNQRLQSVDLVHYPHLAVTPRVQRIPGLLGLIRQLVPEVVEIQANDFVDNCLALAQELASDQVQRITEAESRATTSTASAQTTINATPNATHLLANHTAYALDHPKVAGQFADAPGLGDTITIGTDTFTAIRLA